MLPKKTNGAGAAECDHRLGHGKKEGLRTSNTQLAMKRRGASNSNKKVANSLVVMSSAAVLAVYSAGYVRTRPAADRLAEQVYKRPLEREIPVEEATPHANAWPAAPDGRAVAPTPAPSARADAKRTKVAAPTMSASSAPTNAILLDPSGGAAPSPTETPVPVASPTSAPENSERTVASVAAPQVETPAAAPAEAPAVWKDGKYTAWGTCRHGDIQATVVIEGGRIMSAEITDCRTRYACDVIESLPGKVIKRQKNRFDIVGGATESAYAYYGAVYWALDQATK
jgi:uncharacterized protein with FMN-binding domain